MKFRNWHENTTELCENHPQRITLFFTCRKQAPLAQEWPHRGQEGSCPGLHPILPPALLGCHLLDLPSLWSVQFCFKYLYITKKEINVTWFKYKSLRLLLENSASSQSTTLCEKGTVKIAQNCSWICVTNSVQLLSSGSHSSLCISAICVSSVLYLPFHCDTEKRDEH